MKKLLLAAATVAMLFATSCKKDLNAPENIQLGENEFLATIDNGAVPQNAPAVRDGMGTMTTIDGNRRVFWESGDQITINGVTATAKTDGNPVIFEPEGTVEGNNYHAFYPADIQTGYTNDYGTLPAEQTYYGVTSGQTDVRNLPMYALGGENKLLTFHNICSVLKISVPSYAAGADKIVVSSDQRMNGLFKIGGDYAAVMQSVSQSEDDKKVTMKPLSTLNNDKFAEGNVVYIAVPAQEYTNLRVEFFNGDNSIWHKTIDKCTLNVNQIHNINMTPMELCFTAAASNCTVAFNNIPTLGNGAVIQYSLDGGITWTNYTQSITLANAGDKVYFRASANHNTAFGGDEPEAHFSFTGRVEASGSIMSLYGPDCPDNKTLPSYAFTLMFQNCSTLITAPELPAQTLAYACYYLMFSGCSNLTTAPELPAQTLANYCYAEMFEGCSNLTIAPELPAQTLAEACYYQMFYYCSNLTTAPELPAQTLAYACYFQMFYGCSNLTIAPELPAQTLADYCYGGMFEGCSNLTTAPELPAQTLTESCYSGMFQLCEKLSEVSIYAGTNLSATNCLSHWLRSAGTSGTTPTVHCKSTVKSIIEGNVDTTVWTVEDDLP